MLVLALRDMAHAPRAPAHSRRREPSIAPVRAVPPEPDRRTAGLGPRAYPITNRLPGHRVVPSRGIASPGSACIRASSRTRRAVRHQFGECEVGQTFDWEEFAPDSPLEGDGFEPSVPGERA